MEDFSLWIHWWHREAVDPSRGKAYLEKVGLEWGCWADLRGYSQALLPA